MALLTTRTTQSDSQIGVKFLNAKVYRPWGIDLFAFKKDSGNRHEGQILRFYAWVT